MTKKLELEVQEREGKRVLTAPTVGQFRPLVAPGTPTLPGAVIGLLTVLGRDYELHLPLAAGACVVIPRASETNRSPVAYGERLYDLEAWDAGDAGAAGGRSGAAAESEGEEAGAAGLAVRLTQTGRYYDRPAPDRPPFVRIGDEIQTGQPIGLIEVMKTFNQVVYGGSGLPTRARVLAILCANETEVRRGQEFLRVDPLA